MKLKHKLILFSSLFIIVTSILFTSLSVFRFKYKIFEDKKKNLSRMTDIVFSIIDKAYKEYKSGKATKNQAIEQAKTCISTIRFDNNNYFWLMRSNKILLIHPLMPGITNRKIEKFIDENGNIIITQNGILLLDDIVRLCLKDGEGFLHYRWPKPGNTKKYIAKVSYVRYFKKLDLITGTGVYVEDINKYIKEFISQSVLLFLATALLSIFAFYFFAINISRPIAKVSEFAKNVASQNFDYSLSDTSRKDEIGELASSVQSMKKNLIALISELETKNSSLYESNKIMEFTQIKLNRTNAELNVALKKAEQANKIKSEFLAMMSHELRTPLTGIIGFSELMMKDKDASTKHIDFSNRIFASAHRLLKIISDILELSVIEAGKVKIHYSEFDLNEMINDIYILLKEKFILKNIKFELNTNGIDNIISDPLRINQVILNLVGNALKFTETGKITVTVSQENGSYHFSVTDTGIGITKKDKKIIFEMFRQIENTDTRQHGGAGLGLAISKRLITLMGGKMWVESVLSKGSEFNFIIPLVKITDIPKTEKMLTDVKPRQDKNIFLNKTVLYAEDDHISFELLKNLISTYTASEAGGFRDGHSLVEHISKNPDADLVLLDIQLPGMDGIQVLKKIKIINPQIKIVAITAYAMDDDREKYLNLGFDGYISKPISTFEFKKTIYSVFE